MILDTCALLWLAEGGHHLSKAARERIDGAPVVFISAISAFEIAVKCRAGKLKLPLPPMEWFQGVVDHHSLAVEPLDWDVCMAAVDLPAIHKDPCDRFIIAAAKLRHLPVVTADPIFSDYDIEVIS